jgi:hypothetical protein
LGYRVRKEYLGYLENPGDRVRKEYREYPARRENPGYPEQRENPENRVRKEYREYPARGENAETRASPVSEEPLGKRRRLGSRFIRVRATVA